MYIYIFHISLSSLITLLGLLTLLFQLKFESWESNPIPSMSSQIVRSASRTARSLLSASKNSRFYSGKSFFFLTFYFICTFESFDSQCFDRSLRNDSTILFFFDIYYIIQRKCWILCLLLLENRSYWPLIIRFIWEMFKLFAEGRAVSAAAAVTFSGKLPYLVSSFGRAGSSTASRSWLSGAIAIPAAGYVCCACFFIAILLWKVWDSVYFCTGFLYVFDLV